MDGLECSEVLFSTLNKELRIESEYFLKENLRLQNQIEYMKHVRLGDIAFITDGIHASIDYDENSGINLISATSPRDNIFNLSRKAFISKEAHFANQRTALQENDVILSTVGTIGNCAVVDNKILPANADRHVGIIRLQSTVLPRMLSTFLLTKYGKNQTVRETTGNVQPNLFLYKIKEIKIPVFTYDFQNTIEKIIIESQKMFETANDYYDEATVILENELKLNLIQNMTKNNFTQSFSESFGLTGRLDAEYYQPKYKKYEETITKYHGGCTTVAEEFSLVVTKCKYDENFYSYAEIGDVNIKNGMVNHKKINAENLPANAKIMTKSGDLLVSKVRPNRGAIAILQEDNILVSSAFAVLRKKMNYSAEVLQALLKSDMYKDWMLKYNVGTSYPTIKDDDILNLPIPIVSSNISERVEELISNSMHLSDKAELLINQAKQIVEIAIEQGEQNAFKWCRHNVFLPKE